MAAPTISAEVTRVEVGYFGAAGMLCGLLWLLYRRGPGAVRRPPRSAVAPARLRSPLSAVQAGSFAAAFARSALLSFPRLLLIPLSDD